MAINNLISYELNGVKESFANWISNISPADTPFTSLTGKEVVKNKYFQWQEDWLNVAGLNAFAEGSDALAPGAVGAAPKLASTRLRENVTQILRKVVQVSDTANSLSSYGRGSELNYQMEKAGTELKRDIEWAFLNNGAAEDAVKPGEDSTSTPVQRRKTAGFSALVADKGTGADWEPLAIVHRGVKTPGTIDEASLFDVTESLYLAGSKATHIMYHPKHAQFFSSLMEKTSPDGERQRMFDGAVDQKVNKYVSCLIDPLGQRFCLIPNRFMPAEKIYIFSPSDWTQMIFRAPQTTQLAKNGNYEKYMIEVELGLRHKNRFASGILDVNPSNHTFSVSSGTATLTQSGKTLTIKAAPSAGDIDIDIQPNLANDSDMQAGSVVPDTATADFSEFDKTGFTVTIKAAGNTSGTIVADGDTYTVNVNVAAPVVKPATVVVKGTGVAAGKVSLATTTGTVQLSVDVTPANATDKTVTWASADSATAKVSAAGLVTGVKAGKAVITATANGDNTVKGTVEVTVPPAAPPALTGITTVAPTPTTGAVYDATAKTLTIASLAAATAPFVFTFSPAPAGANLGTLAVTNEDDTVAEGVVGTGANANKVTITAKKVDAAGKNVTIKSGTTPDFVIKVIVSAA